MKTMSRPFPSYLTKKTNRHNTNRIIMLEVGKEEVVGVEKLSVQRLFMFIVEALRYGTRRR